MSIEKLFKGTIPRELYNMIVGKFIGDGAAREVYEYLPDPTKVIKFETAAGSFQNVLEWEVWKSVEHTDIAKWFAPCHSISACGAILIMSKTQTLDAEAYPKKTPRFFTDLKHSNFGMLDDQFVAHDYGLHLLMEKGMSAKLVKTKWRKA